ncbi:C-C motif chemokine 20a.3 [Neoarius graeffei]|uniref:C-C motif chemokine 20a.3 n=1 Tax=Neoarius graeffei TaxID=443677 RepID=UPI00298CB86B|nr:C-C motif chemokine 20a.3 [Neoarius graeffei]
MRCYFMIISTTAVCELLDNKLRNTSLSQDAHFRKDDTLHSALPFIQRLNQGCQRKWKIHRCWVFHYGRYKVLALRQSDTHRPESNSDIMAQIRGGAPTLVLLLIVSLFCQDTAAWGCCRRYSKGQLPANLIRGYSIQDINANCNINAVIFYTYGHRRVCADPSQPWVRDSIQNLMNKVLALKKQRKQQ